MKVVYLHQYFKTPQEGGAVRSYYLAKSLVDDGNEVEMITAHNAKEYEFKVVDGIRVHYLPVYYHNRLGFVGRVISFLKFMYMAYHKVTSIRNVDLCYATSTPLSIGWVALRLKSKHNIPYYFEVRDLWPEAPVQMGVLTNR
ncbi:MAG TPA: glycosyltransferase, partial [Cytophagales bacterium]|nr:glycosyltransferase [Cytophagales bacterium]